MRQPNKERIQLLVDALRSGDFTQTKGKLASRNRDGTASGHCCLGVACEVAFENGLAVNRSSFRYDDSKFSYDGQTSTLPKSVQDWFGFENDNPGFGGIGYHHSAAELNDAGYKFTQLADLFESQYLRNKGEKTE